MSGCGAGDQVGNVDGSVIIGVAGNENRPPVGAGVSGSGLAAPGLWGVWNDVNFDVVTFALELRSGESLLANSARFSF